MEQSIPQMTLLKLHRMKKAFKTTSLIYPGSTFTNAVIDASAETWNDPFNDDQT